MRRKTKRFQISHARLLNFHFEFPRSTSLAVELIAADYSITRLYRNRIQIWSEHFDCGFLQISRMENLWKFPNHFQHARRLASTIKCRIATLNDLKQQEKRWRMWLIRPKMWEIRVGSQQKWKTLILLISREGWRLANDIKRICKASGKTNATKSKMLPIEFIWTTFYCLEF